jgi:hypothetical protein
MNHHDDRLNHFLNLLDQLDPPASLRERALAMAEQAMGERERPDAWRSIWESRSLRLAWAALVVLLLAANVFLPWHSGHQQANDTGQQFRNPEFGDALKLLRLRLSYTQMAMEPSSAAKHPNNTKATTRKEKSS